MLRKLFTLLVCLMAAITTASAQTPPDNEIWYTTTDGKKAGLWTEGNFEENGWYFEITSHTYNNGLGIIHANKPIKAYGYEGGENDVYYELRLTGNNIKTITFPKCTEYFYDLNFSSCKNLRTIKCRYSSSDGRCLIKNGRLLGFAPGGLTKYTIPNSVTEIGGWTFSGCSNLTSITIPNSVTSIEWNAFNGCSSLTSITIPDSVTSIEIFAFAGCSSLKSITIGNGVTRLEDYTFSGCSSLTSITIGNSVKSIGREAFKGCSSLKSITIPNSVTRIGREAFYGCSSLTSITIPNSVTRIGREAFKGCSSLTSITIPDSVTSIGYEAFKGCSSLTSITMPNSVTEIGSGAFADCSSLTSITIPNSVTSIEYEAFKGCSSLTSITIPNSVTEIESSAFSGCSSLPVINNIRYADTYLIEVVDKSLTSYSIQEGTRLIGEGAFAGCSSLTSITIPNSVTNIGNDAFRDCNIQSVIIDTVTGDTSYIEEWFGDNKIAGYTGKYASEDGRCLIVDGKLINVVERDLTTYTIPDGVVEIGNKAFANCTELTSITIPESVTSIRKEAFKDCSNLKSVKVANKDCYDYFKDKIANIAFYGANASDDGKCLIIDGELKIFIAKGITGYTIPESVTSIGEEAFKNCSNLKSVKVANKDCYDYFKDKVDDIAFYGANASDDGRCLILDGKLERFSANGITEYTIPESVTSIGDHTFNGCSNLTSITISKGVKSIGEWTFSRCSSLKIITIPNSVTSIEKGAFSGCNSLTSITIPDSVTNIGNDTFHGCDNLISITCLATTPPAIGYLRIGETTMIYVPKEAVKAYKQDPKWSIYEKQIKRIK